MTLTSSMTRLDNSTEMANAAIREQTAALLQRRHEALVDRWVELLQASVPSYAHRPIEELRSTCSECLRGYEALLGKEDTDPIWRFVERVCTLRASQQFPPSDVSDAFLLFLDAAEDLLGPEFITREAWSGPLRQIRQAVRFSIRTWVDAYLVHLEMLSFGV